MIKVYFAFPVKYRGVKYASYVPFNIEDSDLEALKAKGAFVVEEPKLEEPEVTEKPTKSTRRTKSKAGRLSD